MSCNDVQSSVMHAQICCFVNKNLLFFCRSPSVAVVVGFVVIQKYCYHGAAIFNRTLLSFLANVRPDSPLQSKQTTCRGGSLR